MNLREKSIMVLATGGFIGTIPFAPGTFGSLAGLPLCFFLSRISFSGAVLCTVGFIFFAIRVARDAERIVGEKDPGCIVIDEMAGLMVTLFGLPFDLTAVVAGFLVFRVIDILKPFPIRWLERVFSGGVGVVLDDVAAGIFSNLVLRAVLFIPA